MKLHTSSSHCVRPSKGVVPIRRRVVAASVPAKQPKQSSPLTPHIHHNVTRIDLSYATAVAEAKSATVLPQELWEKVTPSRRVTHLEQLLVEQHHDRSPYSTAGYETVYLASMPELEDKVRVLSPCLYMQAVEPFDLFKNGPHHGPYKAHSKSLDDTLRLVLDPRSSTLVLRDKRSKVVAGFAVMTEDLRNHAAGRLHVSVMSASDKYMFELLLRAVHKHAANRDLQLVTVLTDNNASYERHAMKAHGLKVAPGYCVSEPAPLPASPWAGYWEE